MSNFHINLRSLFLITTFFSVLLFLLNSHFPQRWPWAAVLTLLLSWGLTYFVLVTTGFKLWRGMLLGSLFGISVILLSGELSHWNHVVDAYQRLDRWWYMKETFFFWIAILISSVPLAGCCFEAILISRRRLGVNVLIISFIHHFLIVYFILWLFTREITWGGLQPNGPLAERLVFAVKILDLFWFGIVFKESAIGLEPCRVQDLQSTP